MAIASTLLNRRAKPLQALRGHITLFAAVAAMGIAMTFVVAFVMPIVALFPPPIRRRRAQAAISRMFRLYLVAMQRLGLIQSDLLALDALAARGPLIVAANHPGLLDAMLIVSRLPTSVCLMKSQLFRNPLLGIGSWVAGYIRNDSPVQLVRGSVRALHEGSQLLIFPEGTRTRGHPMVEISGAFATIAHRAGCPVVLIAIETDSPFASKGWPLWRVPAFPLRYRVRVIGELDAGLSRPDLVLQTVAVYERELSTNAFDLARPSRVGQS